MPKKTKIRKNYGLHGRFVSKKELERREKTFQLPKELDIDLSPELQKQYETAVELYQANTTQFKDPPRRSEILRLLKNLREASKYFSEAIKSFSDPHLYRVLNLGAQWPKLRDEGLDVAERFERVAHKAWLVTEPDKGGPTKNRALESFIKKLASIFEQATGKKASVSPDYNSGGYRGEFPNFVCTCLDEMGVKYHSYDALSKHIQRTLQQK